MVAPADQQASASVPSRRTRPSHVITISLAISAAAAAVSAFETRFPLAACEILDVRQITSANLRWMSAIEELLAMRTVAEPSAVLNTTGTMLMLGIELLDNLSLGADA